MTIFYTILFFSFINSLVILSVIFRKNIFKNRIYLFSLILILGIIIRFLYADYFPVTRDEGAYIYDGYLITEGFVPFKDYFTRSPVLLYVMAFFISIFGKTFLVGRILSALSSILSAFILYFISKELFGRGVAKKVFIIFMLLPEIILQTIYGHTQPFLILLFLIATYLFIKWRKNNNLWFLFLSGAFLGLGILVRHSAVLYLFWEIVFIIFLVSGFKNKIKNSLILVFGSIISSFPIIFYLIMKAGFEKVWLTLGPGLLWRLGASVDDSGGFLNIIKTQKIPALYFISQESLFLISAAILFLMPFLMALSKRTFKALKVLTIALFVLYFVALVLGAKKMGIRPEFYHPSIITVILASIWFIMSFFLLNYSRKIKTKEALFSFFIPFAFIITPLLSYGFWTKFHPNYFSEFLIGFSLAAAIFLSSLSFKKMPRFLKTSFFTLSLATIMAGVYFSLILPHTGSLEIRSIKEARNFFLKNAGRNDEIFTSATIIPFLSENPLVLNIVHPTIYKYSWIEEETIKKLGPTLPEIQNYLEEKKVKWVIVDSTTRSDYFVNHDDFYKYFREKYKPVAKIENKIRTDATPINIYEKK